VAEPAQLALDPDYAPPGILPGQAQDKRDELVRDRRAARWPGLPPSGRHQPLVPAQQRAGRHDPPGPQRFRHDPRQSGQDRPVQDMRGLGSVRRSTATSCRSASISTSLAEEDRASSASQDSTVTSSR
jgi:hypothetical protein